MTILESLQRGRANAATGNTGLTSLLPWSRVWTACAVLLDAALECLAREQREREISSLAAYDLAIRWAGGGTVAT